MVHFLTRRVARPEWDKEHFVFASAFTCRRFRRKAQVSENGGEKCRRLGAVRQLFNHPARPGNFVDELSLFRNGAKLSILRFTHLII